jgi:hypothetical protein
LKISFVISPIFKISFLWQSVLLAKHFVPSIYILEEKRVGNSLELHLQIAKKCRLRTFGFPKYALYSDPFVSGLLLPCNLTFFVCLFCWNLGAINRKHTFRYDIFFVLYSFCFLFCCNSDQSWTNPLLPQGIFQGLLAPGLLLNDPGAIFYFACKWRLWLCKISCWLFPWIKCVRNFNDSVVFCCNRQLFAFLGLEQMACIVQSLLQQIWYVDAHLFHEIHLCWLWWVT